MNKPVVSLFASAIRVNLWLSFLESLHSNKIDFEVVFAGPAEVPSVFFEKYPFFNYIKTGQIKPAQCYEIARRACIGELLNWTADDCEYSEKCLDEVYAYWKERNDYKAIISLKTQENELKNLLDDHRFFGFNKNTPLMAPLGFISKQFLDELGGLDRRYVCGQYENDIVMRALQNGGTVFPFENTYVDIQHLKKHGRSTKFWNGYNHDRTILENSWVREGYAPEPTMCLDLMTKKPFTPIVNRLVLKTQKDKFEPYEDKDILTVSQGPKGEWD